MIKTRIGIVDDHSMVLAGLRLIIKSQQDWDVVVEAGNAADALEGIKKFMPDLVLIDISMPVVDGITLSKQVLEALPKTKIIMLSGLAEEEYINQAIQAGARGYMLKSNTPSELISGIRAVLNGQSFLSPEVARTVLRAYKSLLELKAHSTQSFLSDREREVLKLIAEGLRIKEIATRLEIGGKTVETYRARLLEKLDCKNTNQLVRYAIREGISKA